MSDVDKLLAKFETGALLRPSPRVPNIVDLARALAWLAGVDDVALTDGAARLADLIGQADHLIFIVADGLGMMLMEELPPGTFLLTHLVTELRTVFPSATATALTALATGEWPNRHGVTGQWTHLPEINAAGALLPFAARSGGRSLAKLGVTLEQAFPLPSLLQRMRHDVLALFPERVAGSLSSAYFSGHRERYGYRTLGEAIDLIVRRVETADGPTYTYLYSPWIDLEAHRHGARHFGVQAAAFDLDRQVERLATCLAGRARIVLSADHGLLDTPVLARHWLKPSPDLFDALLVPPSGDTRVMYLHARAGAEDRLRRRFRERYGDGFFIISVDEAEQLELFGPGPLAPAARSRLGNLIVLSSGEDTIEYVPNGNIDRVLAITSHHSGLSPAEIRVPLVVVP